MINAKYLLLEYGRRTDSLALKKNFQVVTKGYFAIMAALAKPSTGLIFKSYHRRSNANLLALSELGTLIRKRN